jgi:hypothetical protein
VIRDFNRFVCICWLFIVIRAEGFELTIIAVVVIVVSFDFRFKLDAICFRCTYTLISLRINGTRGNLQ